MPSVKNPREGLWMTLIEFLMIMGQKMNNVHLPQKGLKRAVGGEKCRIQKWLRFCDFLEREREHLLSRFSINRTVGILRSKKESGSTHRGQHVGTGFLEFRQTP